MAQIEGSLLQGIHNQNPEGRIFRVDGDDVANAIDSATADNGDIIIVTPGTTTLTEQLVIDKSGITIVAAELGLPAEEQGEKYTFYGGSLTGAPVKILDPCRIIGIGFAGSDVDAESLLTDCEEQGGFNGGFISLEQCRFPVWTGAPLDQAIRCIGGAIVKVRDCSIDGLFQGFDVGAIVLENDTGGFTPAYTEVLRTRFHGVGSGKHAIVHAVGATPVSVLYAHNYLLPGFLGNQGKFLDNNSVAATGLIADNWLAPLANQAAAFENLAGATLGFADNHYEEA